MKTEKLMVKINPEFQREIFGEIIKKYSGISASSILKIPYSSLRGYKNLYFKSVPKKLIDKLIKLSMTPKKKFNRNIIKIFNNKDQVNKCLENGREKRKIKIKGIKENLPPFNEVIVGDYLDVNKWFLRYKPLLESGFRKVLVNNKDRFISLRYNNFTRYGFKSFEVKIPKKFKIDSEFNYFLGLWCGDRAGGKRFGIVNKNDKINKFTKNFLKRNYQKVEKILIIHSGVREPRIDYDKKFIIKNSKKRGWVLSVHSNNGVLASFFYFIQSNLKEFLEISNNKESFFAGLFDTEGNVSLYNKSFRWACKNEGLIKIYSRFLKDMELYERYSGGCIISYDREKFYNKILPYLKHNKKINDTELLCRGRGSFSKNFLNVLKFLQKNPEMTSKEISKALKKRKNYSELKLLSDFGFISRKGYPYKFEITNKGSKALGEQNHSTS